MSYEITVKDGLMYGPWRHPANPYQQMRGSIHDDAMAEKLGFRGGTVNGSIHMELFPPVLLEAFGPRWFEQGSLSIYFVEATTDREEVRAVIGLPPEGASDAQVAAWLERPDGRKIGEGTAAVGNPDVPSALHARPLVPYPPEQTRILAGLKVGDSLPGRTTMVSRAAMEHRASYAEDWLDWYRGESPWGGSIASPHATIGAMLLAQDGLAGGVGLYGAIELRHVNGPVIVDRPYRLEGTVVAIGTSPKTEYLWFDSVIKEESGRPVTIMRMLYRYMKGASPLYQEAKS